MAMPQFDKTHFLWWITAAISGLPGAAQACRMAVPPRLEDVSYADIVVVGRVVDYRIVRDETFRRQMLTSRHLTKDERRFYADPAGSLLTDYARFDVQVDAVLVGHAPPTLSVTWDNSTFGEPSRMPTGSYLIALRRATSPIPPLRGPSATIMPSPDPAALTVLQAPCSTAFLYPVESEEARAIRAILAARPR